ncbi:MAG TPA: ATP-binding protein [Anditalea sp.]|nr:ATP-binding protein [Anditalea sp.]
MIIIVSGLPGSGKSYFAKKLSEHLSAQYLSSDKVRKDLRGANYNTEDKLQVYEHMAHLAAIVISKKQDLVLDATFYLKSVRGLFYKLAHKHQIPCLLIYITADDDIIKERVSKPRSDSDADYGVYLKIREEFEPISRPHLVLKSTNYNISIMVDKAVQYIEENYDRR